MNYATAAKIISIMHGIMGELDNSVQFVMENEDEEQFKHYRKIVGKLMGCIFLDIESPLFKQYPDLTPVGLRPKDKVAPSK